MTDRKEYGSYEEVHARLVEAMQEACTSDESGDYQTPEIDMSFLYQEPKPVHKKHRTVSRFEKVAAIVIIALLGVNAVLLATDSNESYGDGGLIHRIYEGARGIFTDEDPSQFVELDETGNTYIITDLKQIDSVHYIVEGIYIPKYIPSDYVFESLTINKNVSGDFKAEYLYKNFGNELIISEIVPVTDSTNSSNGSGEKYTYSDRIVNIYNDYFNEVLVADVYFDDAYICIYGKVTKNELLNIAESIYK